MAWNSLVKTVISPFTNVDPTVAGIPGQNMATPQLKIFVQHFVVRAGGSYYDPSYGKTAKNATDYSNTALDALRFGTRWYRRSDITPIPNLEFFNR